ncbi:MAG: FkbM family methyltransferase [Pseudomonadota bacterium]|nr:FkbM family methyltransferase [Pseudomonadota bacterium]
MSGAFSLSDLLPSSLKLTVLDVGAMTVGTNGAAYASLYPMENLRVIGFEPNEMECQKLNENNDPRFQFFPYFAGDGGSATYFETNMTMTGSIFEPNSLLLEKFQNLAELTSVVDTHKVETRRIDDIEGLSDVDYFKIDVQGSELLIFENATKVLQTTTVVHVEVAFVEMYSNQPLFADIDIFMRGQGFQFHTFANYGSRCFKPLVVSGNINKGLNQRLWADVVYVRDFMTLDIHPAEKLLKMAVILNDVYQSFDLCYIVLEAVDKKTGTEVAKEYLARINNASAD